MKTFTQFITETVHGGLADAKAIIKKLHDAGFQGFLVGGCVRDTLLGKTPKDYDVATNARPEQVLKIFPLADKVGAHFGVVIEKGVEIATYRSDGDYGDGRRPDHVHFENSPREDAARRDFTVNAMFMDPFTGHILDFFGGQDDIKHKVLRAVGDPYKRFGEDHLRMLRAVRFASKLGFTIDPVTFDAMKGLAPKIKSVANERVIEELRGAVKFQHGPLNTFKYLADTGMLHTLLPELEPHKHDNVLVHVLSQVHTDNHAFSLAAMLFQLGPKVAKNALKRLKAKNDEQDYVEAVLSLQDQIKHVTTHTAVHDIKRLIRTPHFEEAMTLYHMRLVAGDHTITAGPHSHLKRMGEGLNYEDLHPEKFVSGDDLIAMGIKPGPQFKSILANAENGQLNGTIRTKAQALEMIKKGQLR